MPSKHIIPLALSIALAAPAAAGAQTVTSASPAAQPGRRADNFSIQGGLIASSFSIDDEEQGEASPGAGFHVQGRYSVHRFSLALGLESTVHDVKDRPNDLSHVALFVEPRLTFPQIQVAANQQVSPYVSARVGRSGYAVELDDHDTRANAWLYGAGLGALYELNRGLHLDIGLSYAHASFGTAKADGEQIPQSKFGANLVALRAGVSYRFGLNSQRDASADR